MTPNEYQTLALKTMADQGKILERLAGLGPRAMQLDNAARGLADDCGEVSGAVKKWIEYGRPLDRTNMIEELGDCLWRIAQAADALGATLEDVMASNLRKLGVRYEGGYSDEKAADENRDRAAEAAAVAAVTVTATCPDCGGRGVTMDRLVRADPHVFARCDGCGGTGLVTRPDLVTPVSDALLDICHSLGVPPRVFTGSGAGSAPVPPPPKSVTLSDGVRVDGLNPRLSDAQAVAAAETIAGAARSALGLPTYQEDARRLKNEAFARHYGRTGVDPAAPGADRTVVTPVGPPDSATVYVNAPPPPVPFLPTPVPPPEPRYEQDGHGFGHVVADDPEADLGDPVG